MWGLHSEPAEEELRGNPRHVRLERQEHVTDEAHLYQTSEYFPGARIRESQTYRPDGTLSYRCIFEYADDGTLATQNTYLEGTLCWQTKCSKGTEPGVEVTTSSGPDGEELERVETKRNEDGQILDCTLTELSSNRQTHLLISNFDDQGRPRQHIITFDGEQGKRIRCLTSYPLGSSPVTIYYLPDGQTFELDAAVYKVNSRDSTGNWTKKTTSSATLYRTIEYYLAS